GYSTPVWPPAGIALAAVLASGRGVAPGIFLGSFLVNVGTSLDTTSAATIARSVALAATLGVGAALQALLGAALVRRFVGSGKLLQGGREIAATLLAGAASCVASPTVGVTALWLAGLVGGAAYAL